MGLEIGRLKPPLPMGLEIGRLKPPLPMGVEIGRLKPPLPMGVEIGRLKPPLPMGVEIGRLKPPPRSRIDRAAHATVTRLRPPFLLLYIMASARFWSEDGSSSGRASVPPTETVALMGLPWMKRLDFSTRNLNLLAMK